MELFSSRSAHTFIALEACILVLRPQKLATVGHSPHHAFGEKKLLMTWDTTLGIHAVQQLAQKPGFLMRQRCLAFGVMTHDERSKIKLKHTDQTAQQG
jgi:hypothetical protein